MNSAKCRSHVSQLNICTFLIMGMILSKLYMAFKIAEGTLICKVNQDNEAIRRMETISQIFRNIPDVEVLIKVLKQNKFIGKNRR